MVVRFDTVTVHSFDRSLGLTVVPEEGGWPLGLAPVKKNSSKNNDNSESAAATRKAGSTLTSTTTTTTVSVDDYEQRKQELLRQRLQTFHDAAAAAASATSAAASRNKSSSMSLFHRKNSKEDADLAQQQAQAERAFFGAVHRLLQQDSSSSNGDLETRQWDYCCRTNPQPYNPLFHRLSADERRALLLRDSGSSTDAAPGETSTARKTATTGTAAASSESAAAPSVASKEPPKEEEPHSNPQSLRSMFRRTRSRHRSDPLEGVPSMQRKQSSRRLLLLKPNWLSAANVLDDNKQQKDENNDNTDDQQYCNARYPQTVIEHQARELDKLRQSRSAHRGCSCQKLRAERLHLGRVRAELRRRNALPPHCDMMTGDQLRNRLRQVVATRDRLCCGDASGACECVQQGIECQSNLCGCACCFEHEKMDRDCANPHGMNVLDPDAVHAHRLQFLTASSRRPQQPADNINQKHLVRRHSSGDHGNAKQSRAPRSMPPAAALEAEA